MNTKTLVLLMVSLLLLSMVIFMQISDRNVTPERDAEGRVMLPTAEELERLPDDGGPYYNRLVFEKSPYLLQHAANPVDWYPWGEAAFEKARLEDKPIFLSIGYSTCHWCHVMEHESFEDSTVARLMNDAFVCIKVDREERPDIDQLYMSVTQAMTGSGGWPMTIIMTPDKRPFFAGTYLPKESRYQRIGMLDLIPQVKAAWANDRTKVLGSAERVVDFLKKNSQTAAGEALDAGLLEKTADQLASRYDAKYGGFGQAPKFPSPHNLTFLLRSWRRTGDAHALEMVEKTLQQIRLGGIYDHVGFGVHRYATDQVWLLPHFEKMLYDQAMLSMAYVEAFQTTGKEPYAGTAREIFDYVLRDMTSPEGGFYSAEDADSEGEEGLFYLWKPEELQEALGEEDGTFFAGLFNVEAGGNFADQATGRRTGDSILHLKHSLAELAQEKGMSAEALRAKWEAARKKLFAVREKRVHPFKDDKILTDWNGLMIAALAKGAAALNEPRYAAAAEKAADFLMSKLRNDDGTLLKRFRAGEAGLPGHAEDYAFTIWGMIELYEATYNVVYLRQALALNELFIRHFWDEEHGAFFLAADNHSEDLLVRNKEIYDGAVPSANSVASANLIRLARMTGDETLEDKAVAIGKAFQKQVSSSPSAYTQLMSALDFEVGPAFEVVIVGDLQREDTRKMLRALQEKFIPNKVVIFRPDGDASEIVKLAPYTEQQRSMAGKATAYVCQNFACKAPTTDVEEMLAAMVK